MLVLRVWPERASVEVDSGGRAVSLNYGYDAELTTRDVRAPFSGPGDPVDPAEAHRRRRDGTDGSANT